MIARTWRGVTRADDADAYLVYLEKTGLADYRSTAGNRGVIVQRTLDGDRAIFQLTTFWEGHVRCAANRSHAPALLEELHLALLPASAKSHRLLICT